VDLNAINVLVDQALTAKTPAAAATAWQKANRQIMSDAAVVPIEDEIKGQKPVAFVIRKPGREPSDDEIKQFGRLG